MRKGPDECTWRETRQITMQSVAKTAYAIPLDVAALAGEEKSCGGYASYCP